MCVCYYYIEVVYPRYMNGNERPNIGQWIKTATKHELLMAIAVIKDKLGEEE